MPMPTVVAVALTTVLSAIAALHVYWAAAGVADGGTIPTRSDGTPLFRPGRAATLAVAVALAVACAIVLGRGGVMRLVAPESLYRAGTWAIGLVFLLRAMGDFRYVGLFKRERATRFARLDTRYYTPLCAALGAAALYLAAS